MSTTRWQHAQVMRKVVNLNNGGGRIQCMFADCERDGYTNYAIRECRHNPQQGCEQAHLSGGSETHIRFAFCTQRHLNYWLASTDKNVLADRGHMFGYLPRGERGGIL